MKNPMEMTLTEVCTLLGDRPDILAIACDVFNEQQKIHQYKIQEVKKLIAKKEPKEKVEQIFLTTKELLDAD